ncbi:nitroreductase family protein [Candidatus Woesearchaeota archaeon]|nr:nitroreductase family protein [Candidatus Woesearchaeota archaeon]MCF7901095.1 nitroreductase family protein [Candidatus Woesearchaeota archaeon]MCF8013428.1 nitroreductase family protein [Candidatus Woesearchaeota archaeon]
MDTLNCILARRSVRNYLKKPVEFDKLTLLLKAASRAPSVGNLQDYRFILVTDKENIKGIADHCTEQYWIAQAPVLIVVCADAQRTESYYGLRGQRLYSIQDSAAAIQNILLAAHNMGLGACWVGSFNEDYLLSILNIPDTVRPQAIITIGYADGEPEVREESDLHSLIYFNKYGQTIQNVNLLLREYNKEIEKITKIADPIAEDAVKNFGEHAKKIIGKAKSSLKNINKKQ